jgi:hypothetical protein
MKCREEIPMNKKKSFIYQQHIPDSFLLLYYVIIKVLDYNNAQPYSYLRVKRPFSVFNIRRQVIKHRLFTNQN